MSAFSSGVTDYKAIREACVARGTIPPSHDIPIVDVDDWCSWLSRQACPIDRSGCPSCNFDLGTP